MNTLRQAVEEYLHLRRSLGFKLVDAYSADREHLFRAL